MDRFDKLYVIADEAAIWKQFDQTVKKESFKDISLMVFIFFGMLLYVPMAIVAILFLYIENQPIWFAVAMVAAMGMYWNIMAWRTTRYNVYLSKYLKQKAKRAGRPDRMTDIDVFADEYLPMQVWLYDKKYRFERGFVENGLLVLEFYDGCVPLSIRGIPYERVYTEDENRYGTIVLDNTGLIVYPKFKEPGYGNRFI